MTGNFAAAAGSLVLLAVAVWAGFPVGVIALFWLFRIIVARAERRRFDRG